MAPRGQVFHQYCFTCTTDILYFHKFFFFASTFFLIQTFFLLLILYFTPTFYFTFHFFFQFQLFLCYIQLFKYIGFHLCFTTYYFCFLICDKTDFGDSWMCWKHERTGQSNMSVIWCCIAFIKAIYGTNISFLTLKTAL